MIPPRRSNAEKIVCVGFSSSSSSGECIRRKKERKTLKGINYFKVTVMFVVVVLVVCVCMFQIKPNRSLSVSIQQCVVFGEGKRVKRLIAWHLTICYRQINECCLATMFFFLFFLLLSLSLAYIHFFFTFNFLLFPSLSLSLQHFYTFRS